MRESVASEPRASASGAAKEVLTSGLSPRPVDRSLDAFHPFEDRAGHAVIGGIPRHDLGDVTVILEHEICRAVVRFAELIFQRRVERDDGGRIELSRSD